MGHFGTRGKSGGLKVRRRNGGSGVQLDCGLHADLNDQLSITKSMILRYNCHLGLHISTVLSGEVLGSTPRHMACLIHMSSYRLLNLFEIFWTNNELTLISIISTSTSDESIW